MESNNAKITCKPALENSVPGGVYLCQVDEHVSCGACCGLYNVKNTSATGMEAMLRYRSEQFKSVPRTVAAIDAFARHLQSHEEQQRPFPQFHHCPFIGLIGDGLTRVGCLLHPVGHGNNGVDFRGLSYYGGLACRTYFCPATQELPANYKQILKDVLGHWHLYGLVVTEKEWIMAIFKQIETQLTHPVTPPLFTEHPAAAEALGNLFELKLSWPFRPLNADTPCHHFFFDVSYAKPDIAYDRLGVSPSRYDTLLKELVSEFNSTTQLQTAEQLLDQRISCIVDQLR